MNQFSVLFVCGRDIARGYRYENGHIIRDKPGLSIVLGRLLKLRFTEFDGLKALHNTSSSKAERLVHRYILLSNDLFRPSQLKVHAGLLGKVAAFVTLALEAAVPHKVIDESRDGVA